MTKYFKILNKLILDKVLDKQQLYETIYYDE